MNKSLSRQALRGALELRKTARITHAMPICVYDLAAEKLKLAVRFHAGASFGGMYAKDSQTILVPAERPPGRRAFTCAHELGHWYFNHGTKVEELEALEKGSKEDPDEILANQFAGHLLMPKWAIQKAVDDRNLDLAAVTDFDIYALASQFGVGYETMVNHLRYALDFLSASQAALLSRSSPKTIKERLLGRLFSSHLVMVDAAWNQEIPIDLEVGDGLLVTFSANPESANLLSESSSSSSLFIATKPGISKIVANGRPWAAFVRISRKGFTGRSIYRFLEDPDA